MRHARTALVLAAGVVLGACGGGGSDGGSGNNPPPPSPPAAVTYTASVTAIEVVETGTGEPVAIENLPIEGATLTD